MAIVKCPECAGEISSQALRCPKCGANRSMLPPGIRALFAVVRWSLWTLLAGAAALVLLAIFLPKGGA